jgi:hypothetical protein
MSNGEGCTCLAYGEHECGCGVDWTDQEIYDLRAEVKQLKEATNIVTRFEVIDHTVSHAGRVLVKYDVDVTLDYQDDGTTLKVFLKDNAL